MALALTTAPIASAQIAVVAVENKVVLEDGQVRVVSSPAPDGAAIIDLSESPPRLVAQIDLPAATVGGPPTTVAVAPDETIALVSGGQRHDPADRSKLVDHDILTIVDLQSSPPKVLGTVTVGKQPAGVSFSPKGDIALVANRGEGTVSVLKIAGQRVTNIATVSFGAAASGPSGVVFTPNGKRALVTRDGDSFISVLAVDGEKVEYTRRDLSAGIRPYGITMHPSGNYAAVANIGRGAGDEDTVSLIDLTREPFRVTTTFSVGQTPEGIMFSPDGDHLAVVTMNGSNKPANNPFYNANGRLQLWRVGANVATRVTDAPIGRWSQGIAFSHDGQTVMALNMIENDIQVFRFADNRLSESGRIKLKGGPAAVRTTGVR